MTKDQKRGATRTRFVFPREVLLVEIVRRCTAPDCGAQTRVGLTKEEARAYTGFKCERCETWNNDALDERDVPEWWEELILTGLGAVRPQALSTPGEPSEVVRRMSDSWRQRAGGAGASLDETGDGES